MSAPTGVQFWGKYSSATGKFLSLLAHGLDVAVMFRTLCNVRGIRRSLDRTATVTLTNGQLDRLAVLAMLHDVGKANLGFQDKIRPGYPKYVGHIKELIPLFADETLCDKFLAALPHEIGTWFADADSADSYLYAIFSHHGRPLKFLDSKSGSYWQARDEWWQADKTRDPIQAIAEISLFAEQAFPRAFLPSIDPLPTKPAFHHRFAGLVMLADWLGSHSMWFPIKSVSGEERLEYNFKIAPELLKAIGLATDHFRPTLDKVGDKFGSQFGFPPLPLQQAVDELSPKDFNTRLVVAESETGSGKTEAALNWFCKLFIAGKVDSLYFALPTRVAARELYQRIDEYIKLWFPDSECQPVTLLAVPGYAQVDGYSVKELMPDVKGGNIWQEDPETIYLERYWAGERPKRFLAATIAVGTIDQALLSVIQTAHAHLRSICLDRSLLVIDEVHASDLYMSRLLQSLLIHHLGTGGHAMLLSATLGVRALTDYLQITEPKKVLPSLPTAIKAPYPSLTLADGQRIATRVCQQKKKVYFDLYPYAFCPEKTIKQIIAPALRAGARVLVVMNTVARAIALFDAVESSGVIKDAWLFRCQGQTCPHHGRFAPVDREILDKEVSERFGKGSASGPVLLVGTQTLEQSLDIDADLLITDLAPSDVLLQRVGRLHRHCRPRLPNFERACCVVLVPDRPLETALEADGEVSGVFKQIGYGSVYEDLCSLELTYQSLKDYPQVILPDDNRFLVERATHPQALASLVGEDWEMHRNLIYGRGVAKEIAASTISNIFSQHFGQFEFVESGRAVSTRLGADRLQVPLNRKVMSPFGRALTEMVIPGHMAPDKLEDEQMIVEDCKNKTIILRYQDHYYWYSRYGLEEIE